ncbi:MAG: hypothetical protein MUC64_12260 [Rubritepida sp.]|nr:hypothetical protein [Rubritepida sp.]
MNRLAILGGLLFAAVVTAAGVFFTVQQTQQVLITQFGQPIRVIQEPGLNVKLPFVQSVITSSTTACSTTTRRARRSSWATSGA